MPTSANSEAISVDGSGVGLGLADGMLVNLQEELRVAGRIPRDNDALVKRVLPHLQAVPAQRSGHDAKTCKRFGWVETWWHQDSLDQEAGSPEVSTTFFQPSGNFGSSNSRSKVPWESLKLTSRRHAIRHTVPR